MLGVSWVMEFILDIWTDMEDDRDDRCILL